MILHTNFWTLVALTAAVFVLTYDPKSRTIEKFIGQPNVPEHKTQEGRDKNCKHTHLRALQFGQGGYNCPRDTKTKLGAILEA